jgi:hypothetical protein
MDSVALSGGLFMVGSMKTDRKKSAGNKGATKADGDSATKPDIEQQYERLCQLREQVRVLSEKARWLRVNDRN